MSDATTQTPDAATLMLRRTFSAEIGRLFEALTSAEAIRQWFGPGPFRVTRAASDLRVGGAWVIEMESPEGDAHNVGGEYLEVDPPNSVAFTWAWVNEPAQVSHVRYALTPSDAGTTLTLTHSRLPSETSRDMHGQGWNGALDKLVPWITD